MIGGQGKLWAFGDSFTFGSEMEDCVDEFVYSNNTWQALLAKDRDLEYRCIARGGVSNDWIARNVLKYAGQFNSNDLIIIQWTYFSRIEFPILNFRDNGLSVTNEKGYHWIDFEDHEYFQTTPNLVDNLSVFDQIWSKPKIDNLKKSGALEFNESFYKKIYTDEYGAMNLLKNLRVVQGEIQFKNYRFSFVSNEILKFNDRKGVFKNVIDCANSNNSIWFGTTNEHLGFNEWCTKEKFPRGQYNHPLEQAHQKAFKYVKEMKYV